VRPLDLAGLVLVAGRTLGLEPEEVLADGEFDFAAAEQVLAEAGRAEVPQRSAAVLLHGLVTRRPFGRRSDEVALMAALQLLALNHWTGDLGPPEAVRALLDRVAAGDADVDEVTAWLYARPAETGEWSVPGRVGLGIVGRARRLRRLRSREERGAMFERFTNRARRAVVLAQEEARLLNHNYIGTEHLLLGLIHEAEGVAARALESLGISLEAVRAEVEEIIGQGQTAPAGHIPFTPRAKKVMELSLREARQLRCNYIGTEHILLGLVREGEGVAAKVLVKLGGDLTRVRQQVVQLLSGYAGGEESAEPVDENLEAEIVSAIDTVFAENRDLRREVRRLRELLRRHGIEPDGGESRSA
jgi:Clp amino terminal domain, pathogenicity island component